MFGDMKVATRLALGFGAVIVLLVILSVLSITRLAVVNDASTKIMEDRYPKVKLLNAVNANSRDVEGLVRDVVTATDAEELAKVKAKIADLRKDSGEQLEEVSKRINNAEGKRLFDEITIKRGVFGPKYDELFALAKTDKVQAAAFLKKIFSPPP